MRVVERARQYLLRIPGSIAGQNGDRHLFMAAVHLVVGFDLDEETALGLLLEFNAREPDNDGRGGCSPPWSQERIVYKIEQASAYRDDDPDAVGYLLPGARPNAAERRILERDFPRGKSCISQHQRSRASPRENEQGQKALAQRPEIIETPPLWQSCSPTTLPERDEDGWFMFLRLFEPDDVIWVGRRWDSGSPKHEFHFQTRREWESLPHSRKRRVPLLPTDFGEFTCGSTFKPGSFSRCDANVLHRRFLVTEMDKFRGSVVPKSHQASCIEWLRLWLCLRCVLDSAGKSLHALWDFPDEHTLAWLKAILPPLGFDPAMFHPSQPCRFPGALRADKRWRCQKLLFIDLR